MEAQPLSKDIYNKAKELGVEEILLKFSGGSDQGYLEVRLTPNDDIDDIRLEQEIEDWAWSVYSYSGAGEGIDYGDNIVYDLKNNEVRTEEWYHAPKYQKYPATKLEIEDED